jgi:2-polyprenyl-3-methyl-5-hydroxy-6-metoxy-1,4-benzoquinol methylase
MTTTMTMSRPQVSDRVENELDHGRFLAREGAEKVWGWGTPAGQRRADRRIEMIARGARLTAGARVVEVGCGTGLFTERLTKLGVHVTAVELSPDLLELARGRGIDPSLVTFVHGRFEDVDLASTFDAVVGSSVLHHLEVASALAKARAVLRSGGAIAFAEPNMLNPQIAVQKNVPIVKRWAGDSPDETAFFRWQLKGMLEAAGFVEAHVTPFDWLHPTTPRPLLSVIGGVGRVLEHVPLVREFAGSLACRATAP